MAWLVAQMDWLVSQGVGGALILLLVAFALLVKCADWMVDGAADLARRLRLPPILIGIVIVSIGTTAPELAAPGPLDARGAQTR